MCVYTSYLLQLKSWQKFPSFWRGIPPTAQREFSSDSKRTVLTGRLVPLHSWYSRSLVFLASVPDALVLADARSLTFFAFAPDALVLVG